MKKDNHERLCSNCGIRPKTMRGRKRDGSKSYKNKCITCYKYPNLKDKARLTFCRGCNKEYPALLLDVDHTNGDKTDNRYENYQILCGNCHRLKTHLCQEHRNLSQR